MPVIRSSAANATTSSAPWLNAMRSHYPGFHEPGTGSTLGINKRLWESFDASDRRLIEDAAAAEYARSLAEFNFNNALWLRKLRDGTFLPCQPRRAMSDIGGRPADIMCSCEFFAF